MKHERSFSQKIIDDLIADNERIVFVSEDKTKIKASQVLNFINSLSKNLISRDIKAPIPITAERSWKYLSTIITLNYLGFTYVPLTNNYPKKRLQEIIHSLKAELIIDDDFLSRIKLNKETITPIEKHDPFLAAIYFTSGTSGKPKGVCYSNEVLSQRILNQSCLFYRDDVKKVACTVSFTFIASIPCVLSAIANGKEIHILSEETSKDILKIENYIRDNNIHNIFLSPSLVRLLSDDLPSLKVVFAGGEKMINLYKENYDVINIYGMTEVMNALVFKVDKKYDNTPIGDNADLIKTYIVDENMNQSDTGELLISGPIFSNYLNDDSLTKERKILNPFSNEKKYKYIFKTGDIVSLDQEKIIFLYRKDTMVKINGQRVEIDEIKRIILQREDISECEIIVKKQNSHNRLVCFYQSQKELSSNEFVLYLKDYLPQYMIPSSFIWVHEFTRNINGKIDTNVLDELVDIETKKESFIAPVDKKERHICSAFEKVLSIKNVGIDDDFFRLGGDSMLVSYLISELKEYNLDINDIYDNPTPRLISDLISTKKNDETLLNTYDESFPLTDGQLGIYLSLKDNFQSTKYNLSQYIVLPKSIDVELIKEALRAIINHYSCFSCSFKEIDGQIQMVHSKPFINIECINRSDITLEGLEQTINAPFDIFSGEMSRFLIASFEKSTYLFFSFHHLIFDGKSLSNFIKAFKCYIETRTLLKEDVSIFEISSSNEFKRLSQKESADKYYASKYQGIDYTDCLLDDVKDFNQIDNKSLNSLDLAISKESVALIKSKNSTLTEASIFLAAFAYSFKTMVNDNNVSFCVATSGRHSQIEDKTMGMFVKTLPFPCSINDQQEIVSFINDVQKEMRFIQNNDSLSFSELSNIYNLKNEVMFVYQGNLLNDFDLCNERIAINTLSNKEIIANIVCYIHKTETGYKIRIEYNQNLYLESTIKALLSLMKNIINGFGYCLFLKDVKLLSREEEILQDELIRPILSNESSLFLDYFYTNNCSLTNKIILTYQNNSYTYKEINNLSNNIANQLIKLNIKKNDAIGILLERNEYIVIAPLAVIKINAKYVPLDSSYPNDRLEYMLSNTGAKALITTNSFKDKLNINIPTIIVDELDKKASFNNPENIICPDDDFVVLYTSGSTGLPKGVLLSHENIITHYRGIKNRFEITDKTNIATYASFGFDANMNDFVLSLCSGARLFIIPNEMRLNINEMNDYLEKNKVDFIFLTTQVGRAFVSSTKNKSLKYLLTGGETLAPIKNENNYALFNCYGPTETTVICSTFEVDKLYKNVPIGQTYSDVKFYIIDKFLRRLPINVPGELLICGPQVGKGYINNKEKTDEVFINNPFNEDKKYLRSYKSGDVVRLLNNGNIEFIGRKDSQVKIRGFRIELSEVEEIIHRYKGIDDVAVVSYKDDNDINYLVAYLVSKTNIDFDDLALFIKQEKPSYMVPSYFEIIERIPLNQNGKVNKKLLPKVSARQKDFKKPVNDGEKVIFDIVASLLGHTNFGIDTNLFDVGLNSITSIKLCLNIYEKLHKNINNSALNKHNTISLLFDYLSKEEDLLVKKQSKYPLSKTQEGIFYECLNKKESTFYNIPSLLKFDHINAEKLRTSIVKVINHHPYLLSEIKLEDDGVFAFDNEVLISADDIEIIEVDDVNKIESTLVRPFDLLNERLIRFKIIKDQTNTYLFSDFHHLLFDGTSWSIFVEELSKVYREEQINKERFSSYDYALFEQKERNSLNYQDAKKYYTSTFMDNDGVSLPPFNQIDEASGNNNYQKELSNTDLSLIKSFCENNHITRNAFFSSAFGFLLSVFINDSTSLFTAIYNGRNDPRFVSSLGMFVKTYPILCHTDNKKCLDYIKETMEQMNKSMVNDIYSFIDIHQDLGIDSSVMFVYQGEGFLPNTICGQPYEHRYLQIDNNKSTINFELMEINNKLVINIDYDLSKYQPYLIQSMTDAFEMIINGLINEKHLDDIELLNVNNIKCLESFHGAIKPINQSSVVDCFLENVNKYPSSVAFVFKDKKITYQELDMVSNKIASYLINKKGIKKGDVVSVLASRGLEMVVSPLGIIKAGAVYQALDSSYPKERLNFMMEDASSKLLISNKKLLELVDYQIDVLLYEDIDSLPFNDYIKPNISLNDGFALLYTSGSTGKPKGCLLEHGNLLHLAMNYSHLFDFDHNSILSSYASFGFDACMQDFVTTICSGATTHIIDTDMRLELTKLNEYFEENKITHAFMTTQVCREFATNFKNTSLKHLLCGGETLTPFKPTASYCFYNGYGPTETTCFVTMKKVDKLYKNVPIGSATDNVNLYITDKKIRRLPLGAVGELLISGPQVSRGYINNLEKTKQVFIDNPFSNDLRYKRVYRSGDIVRFLQDGNIQFVGRKDSQVKIRGYRIELNEVEEVIRSFNGIKEATVLAFDEPNGGKFLTSYIVSDSKINIDELNDFIKTKKPSYMVPSCIIQIDHIPLTVNGKINKKELPKPTFNGNINYVAPTNSIEKDIVEAMEEVLSINNLSITSSFFDVGGTSILASKLLLRLLNKKYVVSYSDIFAYPTTKDLADFLSKRNEITPKKDSESIEDYDYQKIHDYLKTFTIERIDEAIEKDPSITKGKMGNVLITGTTGFLGIHVLQQFILEYPGKAYCLIRADDIKSAERKLKARLGYYFFDNYASYFKDGKIECINGSINDNDLYDKIKSINVDTIINCAASVKHFSSDDSLFKTNTLGVRNLIDICQRLNICLVQTSTYSVSGYINDKTINASFDESKLFIGQTINNEYIRTKFLAEYDCISSAMKGFNVKILRLGNLMPRYSDGEFQINFVTNGFMRDMRGMSSLGYAPINKLHRDVDISPIDETAKAVLSIADSNIPMCVYHVYNNYTVRAIDMLEGFIKCGFDIKICTEKEYKKHIEEAIEKSKDNDEAIDTLGGLVAYKDASTGTEPESLKVQNELTIMAMYRLNYHYSIINKDYLMMSIKNLMAMHFFDIKRKL